MAVEERTTATVRVQNIPQSANAKDLLAFFESTIGEDTVFAIEIFSEHKNWKSRGHGKVQFETLEAKIKCLSLSGKGKLFFKGSHLRLSHSIDEVIFRPVEPKLRIKNGVLRTGILVRNDCMSVLERWDGVKAWIMPERKSLEFWLSHGGECYKLEVQFGDVLESCGCCLDDQNPNAVLLKVYVHSYLQFLTFF